MSRVRGWRALRTVVVASMLGALLGGCIEFRFESNFAEDLSARHGVQFTIERAAYEQLTAMGGEGDILGDSEEMEREARQQGFDFETIDNDDYIGWRVGKDVADSRDVGAAFNDIFQSTDSDDADDTMSDLFSGTIEKDGDTYRLNLVADPGQVAEGSEEETESLGMDPSTIFTFVYVATMPGKITETNGTIIGDNQVQWELPVTSGSTVDLMAVSEGSSGGGASSLFIIGAIVALLLIGGGIAAYVLTQRSRQPVPAGAAPAAGVTPMAAGAGSFSAGTPPPGDTTTPAPGSDSDSGGVDISY